MLPFVGVLVEALVAGSRLGLLEMPGLPGASAVVVGFLRTGDSLALIGSAVPLGLEQVVLVWPAWQAKALWLLLAVIRPAPGPAIATGRPFDLGPRSIVACVISKKIES